MSSQEAPTFWDYTFGFLVASGLSVFLLVCVLLPYCERISNERALRPYQLKQNP